MVISVAGVDFKMDISVMEQDIGMRLMEDISYTIS